MEKVETGASRTVLKAFSGPPENWSRPVGSAGGIGSGGAMRTPGATNSPSGREAGAWALRSALGFALATGGGAGCGLTPAIGGGAGCGA